MLKEWLPQHLEANDDLTLEEHSEAFEEEFGQSVSTSTIGRAMMLRFFGRGSASKP
jgi:hypothetical protein